MLRQHLNVIVVLVLAVIYVVSLNILLRNILGWFFLFLPGYSMAKLLIKDWKSKFASSATSVAVFSLSLNPLLAQIIQTITFLNSYSVLGTQLVFSLPILLASNLRNESSSKECSEDEEEPQMKADIRTFLLGNTAFFGALIIGLGLYIQASWGVVAPRGFDIYAHMNLVNVMLESGRALFHPDLKVLSNFYHLLYTETALLTGLDVLKVALVTQVLLGGVLTMTVYYFAEYITGSSVASFFASVLFIAGPPLYASIPRYFYYFHPMWVALAMFPFALVFVHKCISQHEERSVGMASIIVLALFLYHLLVGLMFAAILFVDSLFLLKSDWKLLLSRMVKIVTLAFFASAAVTIPFLSNLSNPFKYVYTTGGLETLRSMLFGVSGQAFTSPLYGWSFFQQYLQEFATGVLPLLLLGVPALVVLIRKKKGSSTFILSCMIVGLLGVIQPYLGLALFPQRFNQPLIIFGATLAGLLISRVVVVPTIRLVKQGHIIRVRLWVSRKIQNRSILIVVLLCYLVLGTYLVFYSPSRQAVLASELFLNSEDLAAIDWIENNIPENSRILMDQYFQFFCTGVTGRPRLYSVTADLPLYRLWGVYPVNVYIGGTDILALDVDYIVISRWCYTTSAFVGKQYFDENRNLTRIYEYGVYAVYQLVR